MMVRRQLYLSERQCALLKNESQRYQIKISELIRRILDAHLERNKEENNE